MEDLTDYKVLFRHTGTAVERLRGTSVLEELLEKIQDAYVTMYNVWCGITNPRYETWNKLFDDLMPNGTIDEYNAFINQVYEVYLPILRKQFGIAEGSNTRVSANVDEGFVVENEIPGIGSIRTIFELCPING